MKIRIDINLGDEELRSAIACLDIEGRKINERSVREYMKTYLKESALDSLHMIDRPYRDPAYKFWDYYTEAKEKLKGIK